MTWTIKEAKKLKRGTKLIGAKVVLEDSDQLDKSGDPVVDVLSYGSQGFTAKDFKKMLLGSGTIASPGGELKILLDARNAVSPSIEESDL